jgi:di/tricarboxylate transporter
MLPGDRATLAAFLAGGLMVLTRCMSTADGRQAVEWPVLTAIGASFGLGTALDKSGAAQYLAEQLIQLTQPFGPIAALAAIYMATMILNELITNNGAAAIAFPFCLQAAALSGTHPRPFVMAVALASSFAFASPVGYQTHMMVFGPGGYRFSDFVRSGVPLNLLMMVVSVILIPIIWPFAPAPVSHAPVAPVSAAADHPPEWPGRNGGPVELTPVRDRSMTAPPPVHRRG